MRITVDLYSGRPNPSWQVPDTTGTALARVVASVPAPASRTGPYGLGFRRVLVEPEGDELAAVPGLTVLADVRGRVTEAEVAAVRRLLETAGDAMSEGEIAYVLTQLEQAVDQGPPPPPMTSSAPPDAGIVDAVILSPYDPLAWNSNPQTVRCNNCYNYAVNRVTNNFAQPGYVSGQPLPDNPRCSDVTHSAVSDGLLPSLPANGNVYKVALVTGSNGSPVWDYHWYRAVTLPAGGTCWAHKPGQTPVTNLDSANQVITNPQNCSRPMYPTFCGYLYVPIPTNVAGPGCP